MAYLIIFFACFSLFANAASTLPGVPANSAVFPIDPMQRGTDLINMFITLTSSPYNTTLSEIAIQSTNYGLIRNVKKITPAQNYTILAVTFAPVGSGTQKTVVLLIEQVVEMVYSTNAVTGTSYIPSVTSGVIPYYPINLAQRSADIANMIATLFPLAQSNIVLQTTLTGSYYAPIVNGLIPNVQKVSGLSNTLSLIAYNNPPSAYIVVAPDQVLSIIYTGKAL